MEVQLTELNIRIVAQQKEVNDCKQSLQAAVQHGLPADIRADLRYLFEGATQVLLALLQTQREVEVARINERAAIAAAHSAPPAIPVAAESSDRAVAQRNGSDTSSNRTDGSMDSSGSLQSDDSMPSATSTMSE